MPADEEECYTPQGRHRGIWLTSEVLAGPHSRSLEVDTTLVGAYEITASGDQHRTFVVPVRDIDGMLNGSNIAGG